MQELSLNVMDIAQNSIVAGASLTVIEVRESVPRDELSISVIDNGKGMSPEQVEHVIDPFFTTRTTRSVGLGVPLFKMQAELTGGSFQIDSELGKGTTLTAVFKPSSVDMIPLGDINSTIQLLISSNPDRDFIYTRSYEDAAGDTREFSLKTEELRQVLGEEVSLSQPDVVMWIKDYLAEATGELLHPPISEE